MFLTYHFPCGKLIYLPDGNDDGYTDEFEFEYEVEPTEEDFKAFFKVNFRTMSDYNLLDETAKLCLEKGAEQQLKRIFDAIPKLTWWKDYLEEDDDFYEFMLDRYYEEAEKEANEQ